MPLHKLRLENPGRIISHINSLNVKVTIIICSANQLTGFYMMATLVFNELI